MYTKILNVQIIVSLLKQHGIRHLVLSAGTRHVPLAHSVENDDYFKCYSVVDERSAGYFAIGLSKELGGVPVAIACTSSTATCNYVPAVAEAYFQHVPLLILTGDRDPYRLGQLEDQMINQIDMYKNFCKKCVQLPIVTSDDDIWYCQRLVNEAILELTRDGSGPVQINFPINQTIDDIADASIPQLPMYNKIERVETESAQGEWMKVRDRLVAANKILVVCGSHSPVSKELEVAIESFFKKYNCVIATEHLSNNHCKGSLNTYLIAEAISSPVLREIHPDLIIFFGGNYVSRLKILIRNIKDCCESWCITPDGIVVDQYQNLTKVFQCSETYFFDKLSQLAGKASNDMKFYTELEGLDRTIREHLVPAFKEYKESLTAFSAMKGLAERIPKHSLLHLSILNSTRIMQMFSLAEDVTVYSNIGTDGIDGSMSTFLGQSYVTDRECFLVIGDLSFFYDMNSLGIREIGKNIHILLVNNGGGSEFYFSMGPKKLPNIDLHISAAHKKKAKEWVEACGCTYYSASTLEEYEKQLPLFMEKNNERPVVMEVFTDKLNDVTVLKHFRSAIHCDTPKRAAASDLAKKVSMIPGAKQIAETKIGNKVKERLKSLL